MIGFRGASRYIDPGFRTRSRSDAGRSSACGDMGLDNLWVMIPFVRTLDEGRKVIEVLRDNGLVQGENGLKVIMMCECRRTRCSPTNSSTSSTASASVQRHAHFTLGLDRDSAIVAGLFDERDPAVKKILSMAIASAKKEGQSTSASAARARATIGPGAMADGTGHRIGVAQPRYRGRHLAGAGEVESRLTARCIVEWEAPPRAAFSIATGYHGLATNHPHSQGAAMWLQLIHRHDLAGWLWAVAVFVAPAGGRPRDDPPQSHAGVARGVGGGHPVGAGTRHGRHLLLETSIGRTRMQRLRRTEHLLEAPSTTMPRPSMSRRASTPCSTSAVRSTVSARSAATASPCSAIRARRSMNQARLPRRLDTLIADIEQARETVHIAVYIWLDDGAGGTASPMPSPPRHRRGVQCRVMVDALGSRAFTRGPRWKQLGDAGVRHAGNARRHRALAPLRVQPRGPARPSQRSW